MDTLKIGLCLNSIANALDDASYAKIKGFLTDIEEEVIKYIEEGKTNNE